MQPPLSRFSIFDRSLLLGRFLLPDKLRAQLPDAHGTGTGDVSEAVTANVTARVRELRVVEYVEEFTPNLERLRFRDRDQLLKP